MDFDKFKEINDTRLNYKELENPSVVSAYRNTGCGDGYRIYLRIDEHSPSKIIEDASYTTTGCGFGVVSLAMAAEWVKGKPLEKAEKISSSAIEELFKFPPMRKNYPESAVEAMQKAIADYKNGTGIQPEDMISRELTLKKLKKNGHLREENLKQVILEGENLDGIDLTGANLSNAFLQNTSFENAILFRTNLRGAFLNHANLKGADLRESDLRWCKLTGAVLEDVQIGGSKYDIGTRMNPKYNHLFKDMNKMGKDTYFAHYEAETTK